ncbi:MAG: hypothetical protein GY711_15540 [bacterium]|nr:hypothetical protein [bacterium]
MASSAAASAQSTPIAFDVGSTQTAIDGRFGSAVAASDSVYIFGAPYDDALGLDSGAAYVFEVVGSVLEQTAQLTAGSSAPGALLGYAVAVDGNRALVGAPGASGSGAVYVFERAPTGGWSQAALLTAADGGPGDDFGSSVSLSGDTALVGAPGCDDAGVDAGALYVFASSGGSWDTQAKLTASDASAGDELGSAVDLDGDLALGGAPNDDSGGVGSGSAYVFARSGSGSATSWWQVAKLDASDGAPFDALGSSVAIEGATALVGAPFDDDRGTDSGTAYVFEAGPAGGWVQTTKLLASDGEAHDSFGRALSLAGGRALVGAPADDDLGTDAGAAYVFDYSGSSWTELDKLVRGAGGPLEGFGAAVANSSELFAIGVPNVQPFPSFPGSGWIQAPCWYGTEDCNNNGEKDWCDIQNGTSNDCNGNYIPDECEPWQCRVDIVFLLDTSSSMCDESETLCTEIGTLDCQIYQALGTASKSSFFGITDTSFCLGSDCNGKVTKTVLGEFGALVPGNPPCCGILDDCTNAGGQINSGPRENWGPAITIVAEQFAWTPGATRLIIPISDEAPWCGNPCDDPGGDENIVQHALGVCLQNQVIVSPVMGNGANACTVALAELIAGGSGGSVFESANAQADLLDGIVGILADLCGPAGYVPLCDGESLCPCGNNAPSGSGAGCTNSTGLGALLRATGSTSLSVDDLVLTTRQLPQSQFGLVFMGPGLVTPTLFGDGLRCVAPSGGQPGQNGLWRFPPQSTGSSGTLALGPGVAYFTNGNFGSNGHLAAGESWSFQCWYRDSAGPCGMSYNLSNAMRVTFTP